MEDTHAMDEAAIIQRMEGRVGRLTDDEEALVRHAVRANVGVSVSHLRYGSDVLEKLIHNDGLVVVGAEYSLETGEVEFFD